MSDEAGKDILGSLSTADLARELSGRLATTTDQSLLGQLVSLGDTAKARQEELAQAPQAQQAEPQAADVAANQGTEGRSQADEWAERIIQTGDYLLEGKFDPTWKIKDSTIDENFSHDGLGWRTYQYLGQSEKIEKLREQMRISRVGNLARNLNDDSKRKRERQGRKEVAYSLSVIPMDRAGKQHGLLYYMRNSQLHAIDGRLVDPAFFFILPREEKEEFLKALEGDASLIEDVFQRIMPNLTSESQLARKKATELDVFEAKFGNELVYSPEIKTLQFPKPVGEVAEPL